MKKAVLFRFISIVFIVFSVLCLSGCRDLFHSPPEPPETQSPSDEPEPEDKDEGVLRIVNSDPFITSGWRITHVYIYEWGSPNSVKSHSQPIESNFQYQEFTLPSGEYRLELISQRTSVGTKVSEKITITKGTTMVIQFHAGTGVFTYPTPPEDEPEDEPKDEGVLRIVNTAPWSSSFSTDGITQVFIYEWGSGNLASSHSQNIRNDFGYREFTLPSGEYRVELNSSNFSVGMKVSEKITITKGATRVVQFNARTGVFTYP